MTMQTTTLPFQVSGASTLAQPQRNAAAGVQAPEGEGFGATLSRAMAPTMAPSAAPTMAPSAAPANKPATAHKAADKPAAQGTKAPAREPAKQKDAAPDAPAPTAQGAAAGTESADPAKDAAAAAESATAAAEAATTPVTDMLAFMASLTQPAPAAPVVAAPVAAQAPAASVAAGGAELQLAALQSAFAKLDTSASADAVAVATAPALPAATDGEAAAGGFSLAAGVQPAAGETADLRSLQQTAQAAVQAEPGKQGAAVVREGGAQAMAAVEAPAPAPAQLQAQAAKLETLANPTAVPADRIPARVGSQAWDNQVSQRIVYMVGKEQAATLTLNPPDLGPVQVVLNVSNDGASVAFSSNQLEVRQALENAIPRLREMMGESGIALGNATVDAGMPDGRQAQQDGERRNQGGASGFGNGGTNAVSEDNAARPATRSVALGDNGLVDTFA
ncbi:flagellar hook-length control protein FliK [Massilia sp. IC2-476]|uniref:flagellar hook-length control protein FliK n=1 Tax=Massilia sp. IC2-476 TaxID=2887199 RepID=UPI001D0F948B|nr:flagellar hook-length control protein FliK [Massilia sp. IC2-476]MCC2970813.1 flagellar hook-length control protein FliK [Massilia sp. IC2-476]